MFSKGDLLYVPQSAVLYGLSQNSICVNKQPSLALFVKYVDEGFVKVVLDGKQWLIKNREVYLNHGG